MEFDCRGQQYFVQKCLIKNPSSTHLFKPQYFGPKKIGSLSFSPYPEVSKNDMSHICKIKTQEGEKH